MTPLTHQLLVAAGLGVATLYVLYASVSGVNGRARAVVAGVSVIATATYTAGVLGVGVVAFVEWPPVAWWLLEWAIVTPVGIVLLALVLRPGPPETTSTGGSVSIDGVLASESAGSERVERVQWRFPIPSRGELMTLLSFPAALTAFYFVVQPRTRWGTFGYLKLSAARASGFTESTPVWAQEYGSLWHAVNRFTHVLVHTPEPGHTHLLFNVSIIVVSAASLFVFLHAVDRRRWFAPTYWGSITVAPVLGTFAFDSYGLTAHGYGASTVAFAHLGIVAGVTGVYLLRRTLEDRSQSEVVVVGDGGETPLDSTVGATAGGVGSSTGHRRRTRAERNPLPRTVVWLLLTVVATLVAADAVVSTASNSVHLTGFVFGVASGTLLLAVNR